MTLLAVLAGWMGARLAGRRAGGVDFVVAAAGMIGGVALPAPWPPVASGLLTAMAAALAVRLAIRAVRLFRMRSAGARDA